MLRYAISDRRLFAGDDRLRLQRVARQAAILAHEGVEYFQIREKDLEEAELFTLTCAVRDAVRSAGARMQVVLNGPRTLSERAGVGWHGSALALAGAPRLPSLSCSVHTLEEVAACRSASSLLLFAPVFGKVVAGESVGHGVGLRQLQRVVQGAHGTPVLALGGVTLQNAQRCVDAGASGIAAIRLFLR